MASISKRRWTYKGVTKSAWSVRYFDVEGRHRGKQFADRAEAEIFHARVGGHGRRTVFEPDLDEVTVAFAAKAYLKWVCGRVNDGRCSADHYTSTERRYEIHIAPALAPMKIASLKLHTLSQWHSGICAKRNILPSTAREIVKELKRIIAFAQRREWVIHNPADALLHELRGIPKRRVRTFEPDEMRRLLEAAAHQVAKATSPFNRRAQAMLECFIHLGAFCGMRFGEIAALDRHHVDMERKIIKIEYNMQQKSGRIKGPKSISGNRTVPMPDHVTRMIEHWLNDYSIQPKDMKRFVPVERRQLIFLTPQARPINGGTLYTRFRTILEKAGLANGEPHHFHATRHFFASWMLSNGGSPADTAALMGHSNPAMTLSVYAHAMSPIEQAIPIQTSMAGAVLPNPVRLIPHFTI